ncbi:MAG TPA: ABC transporter substrate-binding protein [Solirubrobacteraceae bacterium]|jgi:ABC-type branched-subunit amino acid transport system substrate-binding protein|nr:ABC transporter substrate-binding protein [Solirubrobacteraceae bacterium]
MRQHKKAWLAAVAAAVALAGCGSSSGGGGSSGAASSGSPISIMQITQPVANGQDLSLGVRAAVDAINASGGIDGHTLKFTFCQDGSPPLGDPNTSANCARQAVQSGDAAIVGAFTIYDTNMFPILKAGHVPLIVGPSGDPNDATNADAFPVTESGFPILVGQAEVLAQQAHCKKIGVITLAGIPSTNDIVNSVDAGAKEAGAGVAAPSLVTETTADFSPSIAKLSGEGVDCVVDGFPTTAQTQPILQAIKSSGTGMKMSVNIDVLTKSAISSIGPLLNGVYGSDSAYENALAGTDDTADATPQEAAMIANMQKYEPAALAQNHSDYPGYASMMVFEAAVKKVVAAKQPVTAANVSNALNHLQVSTGIVPPLNFAQSGTIKAEPRMFDTMVNFFQVKNGKLVALTHKNYDTAPALNQYPNG